MTLAPFPDLYSLPRFYSNSVVFQPRVHIKVQVLLALNPCGSGPVLIGSAA